MTLPEESYRAVGQGRYFLLGLLDPQVTPGVPRWVRLEARRILRHFPTGEYSLIAAGEVAARVLASEVADTQAESGPQVGLAQDLENLLD